MITTRILRMLHFIQVSPGQLNAAGVVNLLGEIYLVLKKTEAFSAKVGSVSRAASRAMTANWRL